MRCRSPAGRRSWMRPAPRPGRSKPGSPRRSTPNTACSRRRGRAACRPQPQRHQGARAVPGLRERAHARGRRAPGAAAAGARQRAALPADAALRLAQPRARRVRRPQGSARVLGQAALPPERRRQRGLRAGMSGGASATEPVEIFTDGACSGNPGPGGWGAILRWRGVEKELAGGEPATTNNRMEMMAAIQALEALKRPSAVGLYTDSPHVPDGITRYPPNRQRNGWKTADHKPVQNNDLWQRLEHERAQHPETWL